MSRNVGRVFSGGAAGNCAWAGRGQVVWRFLRVSVETASAIRSATLPSARPMRA